MLTSLFKFLHCYFFMSGWEDWGDRCGFFGNRDERLLIFRIIPYILFSLASNQSSRKTLSLNTILPALAWQNLRSNRWSPTTSWSQGYRTTKIKCIAFQHAPLWKFNGIEFTWWLISWAISVAIFCFWSWVVSLGSTIRPVSLHVIKPQFSMAPTESLLKATISSLVNGYRLPK